MIEMRVGEDDGMYRRRLDRERRPVSLAQLLQSLKEPAVHQHARTAVFDEVFRAGDRSCGTQECQLSHATDISGAALRC